MAKKISFLFLTFIAILCLGFYSHSKKAEADDEQFITYVVNPKKQQIGFYWKNEKGERFMNAQNLKQWLQKNNKELVFATNGGMYKKDHSPQGLYIENKVTKVQIDTTVGNGNFYLKPNGVFYITTNTIPVICSTPNFIPSQKIKHATQSGPMLVIDGQIHHAFNEKSTNINIRNGVGILPNNQILFAISKKEINFYDFAAYFKKMGCKNALYLDGFVSRTYLPEKKWMQTDGDFGVLIAVTTN